MLPNVDTRGPGVDRADWAPWLIVGCSHNTGGMPDSVSRHCGVSWWSWESLLGITHWRPQTRRSFSRQIRTQQSIDEIIHFFGRKIQVQKF